MKTLIEGIILVSYIGFTLLAIATAIHSLVAMVQWQIMNAVLSMAISICYLLCSFVIAKQYRV